MVDLLNAFPFGVTLRNLRATDCFVGNDLIAMWFQEPKVVAARGDDGSTPGKLGVKPTPVTCDRDAAAWRTNYTTNCFIFAVNLRLTIEARMRLHQLVWWAILMRKLACGKQIGDRERVVFGETDAEKCQ